MFLMINSSYWFSETYIVGVEACCIGNSCLKQTSFSALVDSGTSFTFLPNGVFETITQEVLYISTLSVWLWEVQYVISMSFNSLTDE